MKYWKEKLIFLAGYAGAILFLTLIHYECIWKTIFGIPCPGCGMTRAWLAAFRLDMKAAFSYHPMFWSVPIVVFYLCFEEKFLPKRWAHLLFIFIAAGFLLQWILKIYMTFTSGFQM